MKRNQKITLGEMRASGVRGLLIYCSDYKCSHWTAISLASRLPRVVAVGLFGMKITRDRRMTDTHRHTKGA